MGRRAVDRIVVVLVLIAAGAAVANGQLPAGSSNLTAGGTVPAGSMVAQSSTATTPNPLGQSTGVPGAVTSQVTSPPPSGTTTPTTSTAASTASSGPTVDQIVSVTRTVEAGTSALNAFTVPAGRLLVLTDVLITNPGASPACGASISPSGGSSTGATPSESGTGLLCVPAQTSLNLGLTTGLEFTSGQGVLLGNTPGTASPTNAPLHFHLRGFLATTSG
jgi:hypothetical protein